MWTKGKKSAFLAPRGRKREFPIRAVDYELLEPIGDGATAVVAAASASQTPSDPAAGSAPSAPRTPEG